MKDNASAQAPHLSTEQRGAKSRKYRQAAAGYFIYGLIYLLGALYLSGVGEGPDAGLVWFLVGAAMVVAFPILIWMELKWVTRVLAFLVAIRVLGLIRVVAQEGDAGIELPWGGDIRLIYGAIIFAVIAATECYMLVRAGWDV